MSAGSKVGFFSRAVTSACFSADGSFPVVSDVLHVTASTGASWSTTCFSSHVGIGSSWQCLDGALVTSFQISSTVTGWKSNSLPLANRVRNGSSNCPIPCADGDAAWRRTLAKLVRWRIPLLGAATVPTDKGPAVLGGCSGWAGCATPPVVIRSHRRLKGGPGLRWPQPAVQPHVDK